MSELKNEIKTQLEKYCTHKMDPFIEEDEKALNFRNETYQGIGELGFCGITTSEEFGGAGLKYDDLCTVLSTIAEHSVSYAVTLSVSCMVQSILQEFGNLEQKKKYLPELASGKEIGSFALSESYSGSDAASLKATAKETDQGFILNGSKMWITSAGISKTYIVMARTGKEDSGSKGISAFIVTDGMEGFSIGKKEDKMGWKTSPTREIIFDNCLVPKENLLSEIGMGFKIALSALNRGRITIGSIGVGLSRKALEVATKYALTREQFSQPIFNFQGLQFMLSDMATEIEAADMLVQRACSDFDQGIVNIKLSAMAKMKATDVAMKVTTDAVQVLGGVGYTSEYPTERFMRDAKVLQIVEGTNQIQKLVIARELKKEYSK